MSEEETVTTEDVGELEVKDEPPKPDPTRMDLEKSGTSYRVIFTIDERMLGGDKTTHRLLTCTRDCLAENMKKEKLALYAIREKERAQAAAESSPGMPS